MVAAVPPPLVEAVTVGNPDVIVLALLLAGAGALAGLAKVYAAVPLLLGGQWRQLAGLGAIVLVSMAVLPWGEFLASDPMDTLARQSGGRSAFEIPLLIPFVILALWRLGRERARWLLVPGLWPMTQLHYALVGLPGTTLAMAFCMALPLPGSEAVGIISGAIAEHTRGNGILRHLPSVSGARRRPPGHDPGQSPH